jgi:hypothetical protein
MNAVINSVKYVYWLGNPPNQEGEHLNTPPQTNLISRLGQGAMAVGGTLTAYGTYILLMDLGKSRTREIGQKESTFVFQCMAKNGERYYDCRTNYKSIPDRIIDEHGYAICDKLTPPYILDEGVPAYYCNGLYLPLPITVSDLIGPAFMVVGTVFTIAGFYCNKKGKSIEVERQIALAVVPINAFISDHFDELTSTLGMKIDGTNVYVCLVDERDCLSYERFKDEGKDQVEWCLIKKGDWETKTEYYLLQASSAKQISTLNPYTNLPLQTDDILRGQAVVNKFMPK